MSAHTLVVVAPGPSTGDVGRRASALGVPFELNEAIDPVGDLDPRRRWPSPAPASAVLQLDGHDRARIERIIAGREHELLGVLLVERRELFRDGHDPAPGPRPGLTQLSFVASAAGVAPSEFASRYEAHMQVVRTEHPGAAHYRQDVVIGGMGVVPPLDSTVAVSQLWFPTTDDFGRRYYATDASAAIVRADVSTFLDFSRTWSVLTRVTDLGSATADH